MTMIDPIADALVAVKNSDQASKKECEFKPGSKLLKEIFRVMQEKGYIEGFDFLEDRKGDRLKIKLRGKINECKAIKPRYAVKKDEFEKFEKRYLPAKDVGIIIVTTPKGVLTHMDAKTQGLGGRLLAYVY
ncbi:MAG: 30S ribosomal protein S8 [Candidatus Diapherotrites archaeon]|nr:30S ribosomal protein S8 [Candidatus Diapherotrites archaeon]